MIGDDAERSDAILFGTLAQCRGRGVNQMTEKIGLENAVDALQDAGHALQSHAGVDRGARQRHALLFRHLIELHEDEIPEFEEAIAVLLRAARRAAPDMLAAVDEDLGARAARTRVSHRPEIV